MVPAIIRILLYLLLLTSALLLAVAVVPGEGSFVLAAGKSAGLLGLATVLLQALLAARLKAVTATFGLDVVIRFHRAMGVLAGVLLVVHPVLVAAGENEPELLFSLDVPWYIWVGKAALLVLLLNVLASSFRRRLSLPFERWRAIHNTLVPAVILLALAHALVAGPDLQHQAVSAFVVVFAVLSLGLFGAHRYLRPAWLRRNPWRVQSVQQEAAGVHTLTLAPPDGQRVFEYLPGQFHFLTLHRGRGLPEEEHHFTIASSPAQDGSVQSTIRAVGDFTATIGDTRAGDPVSVQGPFGRFSYLCHPGERDLVFIAGGIGITPLMGMLRCMRDRAESYRVLLLYANHDESRIVFRDELAAIAAGSRPDLTVVHALTEAGEDYQGERGRIDGAMIRRHAGGDLSGKTFYVCGPEGLREAVINDLRAAGVPDDRIRMEIFSLVD